MYKVSVSVDFDFTKATLTDSVSDTISYADILDIVKREMAIPSGLLEHVAGRIANAIFCRLPQVSAASVTVIKENPPMGADCGGAGVSLDWRNPGLKDA